MTTFHNFCHRIAWPSFRFITMKIQDRGCRFTEDRKVDQKLLTCFAKAIAEDRDMLVRAANEIDDRLYSLEVELMLTRNAKSDPVHEPKSAPTQAAKRGIDELLELFAERERRRQET